MGGRHGIAAGSPQCRLPSAPGPLMAASLTAESPHGRSPHGRLPGTHGSVRGSVITVCPSSAVALPLSCPGRGVRAAAALPALAAHLDLRHKKSGVGGCFWLTVFRIKNFLLNLFQRGRWCPSDVPAPAEGQVASSGVLRGVVVIVEYLTQTHTKGIKSPTFLIVIVMVTRY